MVSLQSIVVYVLHVVDKVLMLWLLIVLAVFGLDISVREQMYHFAYHFIGNCITPVLFMLYTMCRSLFIT
jgi:hypothetical protein